MEEKKTNRMIKKKKKKFTFPLMFFKHFSSTFIVHKIINYCNFLKIVTKHFLDTQAIELGNQKNIYIYIYED